MKKIVLLSFSLLLAIGAMAQNTVVCSVENFSIAPGEKKTVTLNLANPENNFCAFQFDLQLPAGISVEYDEQNGKYLASLAAVRNGSDHGLMLSKVNDTTYRFVCFSAGNNSLKGTDGALVEITLSAAADIENGELTGNVLNAKFTPKKGKSTVFDNIPFNVTSTTGIKTITVDAAGNEVSYDLNGRRVNETQKGVLIQNGKKVVVK